MKTKYTCHILTVLLLSLPAVTQAQATRSVPYDAQLRSDPSVGNVQGIQRYGRSLKTDPDQGTGFSYHVYRDEAGGGFGTQATGGGGAQAPVPFNATSGIRNGPAGGGAGFGVQSAGPGRASGFVPGQPFDATEGLRNQSFGGGGGFGVQAAAAAPGATGGISHQPLIQVRVRIIDVQRSDKLAVSSVLDYVSQNGGGATLINGNNINNNFRNLSGASRFPVESLIGVVPAAGMSGALNGGAGMLVNLTSDHINYITSLLATEFKGDIVTAPEVTTLNGQNVEFIAGQKQPFAIGQNVIQGTNNNIQQFFYKHVGTYVSVTPRIVNWGDLHQGRGRVPSSYEKPENLQNAKILPADIEHGNFNLLLTSLKGHDQLRLLTPKTFQEDVLSKSRWNETPELVQDTLNVLNGLLKKSYIDPKTQDEVLVNRELLYKELKHTVGLPHAQNCPDCDWTPNDCTIDLEIVVRLSDAGTFTLSAPDRDGGFSPAQVSNESNVRAISNIVQVKSGHGVVMAGLIGESDIDTSSKVPVLGDIPFLGYLFRSKSTGRTKTETLIFVEARVLDREPELTLAQTAEDFTLGECYVSGHFLDNPLEYGAYRAGFGSYLPPHSHAEYVFWERLGRDIRRVRTQIDDAVE